MVHNTTRCGSMLLCEMLSVPPRTRCLRDVEVLARDLVRADDGYFEAAIASVRELLRGRRPTPFRIAPPTSSSR